MLLRLSGSPPVVTDAWLELTDIGKQMPGNDALVLPDLANTIRHLTLHVPTHGVRINYGAIHTKVNTESSDIAMKSSNGEDGFLLSLDLNEGGGFLFHPGRNSVELEYEDQYGRPQYYNFLLDFHGSDTRNLPGGPAPQPPERRSGKLYAVLIGISKYDHLPSLQYADKDAESFLEFLRSPAGGSIAEDDVELLLNEKATTQNVRHALFTFLTKAQPQDTVVVYIAGHGAPDPHDQRNLYLLTADSRQEDMGATAFPMWQLQDVFDRVLKAHRVLTIADTCHSYGFSGERNQVQAGRHANNLINQYVQKLSTKDQRAVITASDISELSIEGEHWGKGHGVFTYYLLKGLKGEADSNHDGVVTAGEIFNYLKREVPAATDSTQHPQAMVGLTSGLVISNLHGTRAEAVRSAVPMALAH